MHTAAGWNASWLAVVENKTRLFDPRISMEGRSWNILMIRTFRKSKSEPFLTELFCSSQPAGVAVLLSLLKVGLSNAAFHCIWEWKCQWVCECEKLFGCSKDQLCSDIQVGKICNPTVKMNDLQSLLFLVMSWVENIQVLPLHFLPELTLTFTC